MPLGQTITDISIAKLGEQVISHIVPTSTPVPLAYVFTAERDTWLESAIYRPGVAGADVTAVKIRKLASGATVAPTTDTVLANTSGATSAGTNVDIAVDESQNLIAAGETIYVQIEGTVPTDTLGLVTVRVTYDAK